MSARLSPSWNARFPRSRKTFAWRNSSSRKRPAQPFRRSLKSAREKIDATQFHRAGKLYAFKGTDADKNAYRAGQWLAACFLGSEKSAQFCRDNGIAITRAHSEGTNTSGGFLVPRMERTIIDLREEYGTFRSFAEVKPMSSDTQTQPRRTSGLTAYWTAEAALGTESSKGWDNVSLVAKKLMAIRCSRPSCGRRLHQRCGRSGQ
jgi:HK97 family phage major capsid protein